jgi:selenium-binding protein 1
MIKKTYRFVGIVVSLKDLSASVWLWHKLVARFTKSLKSRPTADPERKAHPASRIKGGAAAGTDINLSLGVISLISC